MAQLQAVRGTQDLLPADASRHRMIMDTALEIAGRYGFAEMATPIFEFTEVFARPIGEATDVVSKEMYTFADRGGEEITLRPEGTAGVARAVIENGLTQSLPLKFFYSGPMFRYERPQKGRYRQFHQIGAELIGPPQSQADVEIIALGAHILDAIGVADCQLELNTLGDSASRQAYRAALVEYFIGYQASLSADSQMRLQRNPLRILDSKDEGDKAIVADAPVFDAYINDASRAFFDSVRRGLDAVRIPYTLNPRLVRGLDYYCHTTFEFTTQALGAQGTVLAGGRYDGLFQLMGGPDLPAVGWAAGIERLAMLGREPAAAKRPIAVVPVGDADKVNELALHLAHRLRQEGFSVDVAFQGNVNKRLKRANKINACAALILGEDEVGKGTIVLRDLDGGTQREISRELLASELDSYR